MTFERITVDPDKLEGRPCIRGLRISVESIVRLVAAGWTVDQILSEYPDLEGDLAAGSVVALTQRGARVRRLPLR